jgi:peptide/nickel transport system substrate-binding protein
LVVFILLMVTACGGDDATTTTSGGTTATTSGGDDAGDGGDDTTDTTAGEVTATTQAESLVGGTLVAAVPEDFDAIDPHTASGETGATWLSLIYETLVGVDSAADAVPGLASSWDISADGLTYTFTLRDGVTFHNGRALTSADVKFNYERIINPETAAVSAGVLSIIDSIETPDDSTVVITLTEPSGPFLSDLAQQGRTAIVAPESYDATNVLTEAPAGTGPYMFDSFTVNDRLVMSRNADYWAGAPYIESIEVRIIPDDNARLAALESGEIDLAWAVPPDQGFAAADAGGFVMQEIPQNRGQWFSINTTKAPFDDPRVRRALHLAVSRSDIAEAGWDGFAVPTNQPFAEESYWFADVPFAVDGDLDAAAALLAEAGVSDLSITIVQWDALGSDLEAQLVASAWTEIGADVTIEKVDIGTLLDRAAEKTFDVLYLWIGLITDPNRPYGFFESTHPRNPIYGYYQSPELDGLVSSGRTESDPAARQAIYEQILEMNYDDGAVYFTVRPQIYVGVSDRVNDFEQGAYYVSYQGGGLPIAYLDD